MSQPASEPARKRQRVTQACHRCRGKKYKCDSERPSCSTCRSSNSECIYGPVAKRRGLQSGYVKALEILWGLVFRKVEGSQLVVNELLANLSSIIHPSPDEGTSNGIDRADDLLNCWRNSGVPSAIELMLDGEFISNPNGTLEGVDGPVDHSLASVQTWSLPGMDLLQGTPPQAPSPQLLPQVPSPPAAAVVPIASCPSEDVFTGHQSSLSPLPPDWHSLTQVYLTVEHSWFPILERHTLFRIAYQYQDEIDSQAALDDRHRGEYATLWAVLALGEIHSSNASSSRAVHFKFVSRYFLDKDPILDDYASYIQALLLWSVIHLGCNKMVLARSMLAQAFVFCCAVDHGISQRQRTLALSGCFVMDALLSLALDTRPLMSVDDLPATVPCDETGSDEWEPYVDRFGSQQDSDVSTPGTRAVPSRISSTFNSLVKLTCILNVAMREQTSATDLLADIQTWGSNRPPHLTMSTTSTGRSPNKFLPPQLHLRAVHSAILSVVMSRGSHAQPLTLNISSQQTPMQDAAAYLLDIKCNFGLSAMPASVSILVSLLPSGSTSSLIDHDSTPRKIRELVAEHKTLWGWDLVPSQQDQYLAESSLINQSESHLLLPGTSQDTFYAAMNSGVPHDLSANYDLGNDIGQSNVRSFVPDLLTSTQPDSAVMDMNLVATSVTDDPVSGNDSILSNTPTQLLDYLALLHGNESAANNQDFMQSLGFFMDDHDYTNA